jgi:hypothetical protein
VYRPRKSQTAFGIGYAMIWVSHNVSRLKMESDVCAAPSDSGAPSVSPKLDTAQVFVAGNEQWQIRPLSEAVDTTVRSKV